MSDLQWQKKVVQALQDDYRKKREKNRRYSISAYAKTLGMNDSTLGKILRGERGLGRSIGLEISEKLGLDLPTSEIIGKAKNYRNRIRNLKRIKVEQQPFKVGLCHHAFLELTKLHDFQGDMNWAAKKMGLPVKTATHIFNQLISVGWAEKTSSGWRDSLGDATTTPLPKQTHPDLKKIQSDVLEQSAQALKNLDPSIRNHTAVFFACGNEDQVFIADKVREFRRSLAEAVERRGGKKNHVYALQVGVFPVHFNNCEI